MTTAKVRSFPENGVAKSISEALRAVPDNYRTLFGDELGQEMAADPSNLTLRERNHVLTGIYTGRTARGARVVAFAHVPHYLSDPNNIEAVITHGLSKGAATTPQVAAEMPRLLKLEGQGVFVIPYEQWEKTKKGLYTIDQAMEQPFTIAFLGGMKKAENYLRNYQSTVFGNEIKIWKTDDPNGTARLAVFGYNSSSDLDAIADLNSDGRFAAVQRA